MKSTAKVKVFIDTNVLLDYLIPSREKHESAVDVFSLVFSSVIEGEISVQSMLDAIYVAQQMQLPMSALRENLAALLLRINVDALDMSDLKSALLDPDPDIEDSAQISFAFDRCCDFFLTSDRSLLSHSLPHPMAAMTAEAFIMRCLQG